MRLHILQSHREFDYLQLTCTCMLGLYFDWVECGPIANFTNCLLLTLNRAGLLNAKILKCVEVSIIVIFINFKG